MDNAKTGAFIRSLRKEQGLTQRDLAERLHITDRAVSKWERGLCAPDIALLEPLAGALGVSVLELIQGERTAHTQEMETSTKAAVAYSSAQLTRKVRSLRKVFLGILAAVLVAGGALLWRSGLLFVIDRSESPDASVRVTVYRKALSSGGFSREDAVSLIEDRADGGTARVTYGDSTYRGHWSAPDSKKYVLALEDAGGTRLVLNWLERNSVSNLSAYLSLGVEQTELRKYGYANETGWPVIDYQFLQWGADSASMLICYAFADRAGEPHTGYFWYNCETGAVSAILELEP